LTYIILDVNLSKSTKIEAIFMAEEQNLPIGRNLKIGLFHLGSGMADVMATGIWNRIMISDLGFSATPIGLLVSLRYFLAPLGVWAGRMSDRYAVGGYRRLFWIWMGRALMVLSLIMLGLSTAHIARGAAVGFETWAVLTIALLMFSLGNALSGSTFLALVYDRTPERQRGRAVGLVWTFLLLGFTIGGILFGVMLPSSENATTEGLSFSPETLQNLFVVAALILGSLWFFSLLGEEQRSSGQATRESQDEYSTTARADLKLVWQSRPLRFFLIYLVLSMLFAFAQDLVLEPFGAEVFKMDARHTTRFAAYWGSMAILGTLVFLFLSRRIKWLTNTNMSILGVIVLIATFALFALSSLAFVRPLVTVGLITLGIGLGLWNVGTLGLMMDMSPSGRAGTFLGFWTLAVTLARGFGVSSGGIIRDIVLQLSGNLQVAYASVFILEVIGLSVSLYALSRVNVKAFKGEAAAEPVEAEKVFAGAMD
jgi:MFS transporter, BCD family, chlorophyll transporter